MRQFYFVLIFISLLGCNSSPGKPEQQQKADYKPSPTKYSFFVAGHVYGVSEVNNPGVHPPFKRKFPWLRSDSTMRFGVFTGDIVYESTVKDWEEVDRDVKDLGIPVYYVIGNHDAGETRELFRKRYGKTYFSFDLAGDRFIILNSNANGWNIEGDQLDFLKSTLNGINDTARIFVFVHHVIWWEKDNKFKDVQINSSGEKADSVNFWSTVEPLFHHLPNPVYFFAGDMGGISYDEYDNIHLVASGMGGPQDNFLIVKILKDRTVDIDVISLKGAIDSLGKIQDYLLPRS